MTTIYTNLTKPSGTSYTNTNTVGKQQYDQSSLTYDDSSTFYDGINQSQYTNLIKPTINVTVIVAGTATGLLMPPTYAQNLTIGVDPYTRISKPT